jgi:hypothetical protein
MAWALAHISVIFHASDEHGPNSAPYIVLGHSFWHTRFHDDRGVVGRVVRLNVIRSLLLASLRRSSTERSSFSNPHSLCRWRNASCLQGQT